MKSKKVLVVFLIMIIIFFGVLLLINSSKKDEIQAKTDETQVEELDTEKVNEEVVPVFSSNKLTDANINRMNGLSWKDGAPVNLDELRYLEVTYWGFDDETHVGELVVHEAVADEVVEIFNEIYEAKFPIESIKLVDDYNADDNLSMDDNNTSAFNYRVIAGSDKLSMHSYGLAIDINPIQNPYVKGDIVSPSKGKEYLDRDDIRKGMIIKDDACYNAFVNRGWTWGGNWDLLKDYQHFEKNIYINE